VTALSGDRRAEMNRVFRLWEAAESDRGRDKYLLWLWELCRLSSSMPISGPSRYFLEFGTTSTQIVPTLTLVAVQ
jgi:hypothetical protein